MAKKTVLITGCSKGGLGFALADIFQQHGYHVFATARDPTKVGSLRGRPHIEILALDVTSSDSITSCVTEVHEKTDGKLDVLVNNAGSALFGPLVHANIDQAKSLYDVNVWGLLATTQSFAPLIIDAGGVILNISSMAGAVPLAWQGVYNSSKAAVTFLSETLKIELEPLGVRVITAMVGAMNTQIYSNKGAVIPSGSWYKPIEEIIERQARGEMQEPNNEPVEITARNIVRDTLSGRRGKIWRGGEAGMASVGSWLFPTRIAESVLHRQRGLSELRRAHRQSS